jgi:hypothetical protein
MFVRLLSECSLENKKHFGGKLCKSPTRMKRLKGIKERTKFWWNILASAMLFNILPNHTASHSKENPRNH